MDGPQKGGAYMSALDVGRSLCVSLALTVLIEEAFALFYGIRKKKDLLLVFMVNLFTNPLVVLLYYLLPGRRIPVVFLLEAFVVLAEAYYYKSYGEKIRRPFAFSLLANMVSYGSGLALNALF